MSIKEVSHALVHKLQGTYQHLFELPPSAALIRSTREGDVSGYCVEASIVHDGSTVDHVAIDFQGPNGSLLKARLYKHLRPISWQINDKCTQEELTILENLMAANNGRQRKDKGELTPALAKVIADKLQRVLMYTSFSFTTPGARHGMKSQHGVELFVKLITPGVFGYFQLKTSAAPSMMRCIEFRFELDVHEERPYIRALGITSDNSDEAIDDIPGLFNGFSMAEWSHVSPDVVDVIENPTSYTHHLMQEQEKEQVKLPLPDDSFEGNVVTIADHIQGTAFWAHFDFNKDLLPHTDSSNLEVAVVTIQMVELGKVGYYRLQPSLSSNTGVEFRFEVKESGDDHVIHALGITYSCGYTPLLIISLLNSLPHRSSSYMFEDDIKVLVNAPNSLQYFQEQLKMKKDEQQEVKIPRNMESAGKRPMPGQNTDQLLDDIETILKSYPLSSQEGSPTIETMIDELRWVSNRMHAYEHGLAAIASGLSTVELAKILQARSDVLYWLLSDDKHPDAPPRPTNEEIIELCKKSNNVKFNNTIHFQIPPGYKGGRPTLLMNAAVRAIENFERSYGPYVPEPSWLVEVKDPETNETRRFISLDWLEWWNVYAERVKPDSHEIEDRIREIFKDQAGLPGFHVDFRRVVVPAIFNDEMERTEFTVTYRRSL